jgi:hypothetical protein
MMESVIQRRQLRMPQVFIFEFQFSARQPRRQAPKGNPNLFNLYGVAQTSDLPL